MDARLFDDVRLHRPGGPCKYTGKDMKSAHAGMGIGDVDFNALVEDLTASLDKFNVGEKKKGELLNALASRCGGPPKPRWSKMPMP